MDQSDARWGSLREAARRFLRTEGVRLGVPVHDRFSALKLVERIAEKIPERHQLPQIVEGFHKAEGLFQLGGEAPNEKLCWVPGNHLWNDFVSTCDELLEAGYPGCQGCGGTAALQTWNEVGKRKMMLEKGW